MFQKRPRARGASGRSVPQGTRVYAVGDIHGCLAELEQLLARIEEDCAAYGGSVQLVFVGDLVDRGPDSAGVVRTLRSTTLPGQRSSFLMGNHEEAFVAAYDGDAETLGGWLSFGGLKTLESYGIGRGEVFRLGADLPGRMREAVPAEDIAFLRGMEDQVTIGDYLFVHAGIRPGTPLAQQDPYDLRWIRGEFLDDEDTDHGVTVVHGHTICDEPQVRSNRIGIDTGCYSTGRLTALVLEGATQRFIGT